MEIVQLNNDKTIANLVQSGTDKAIMQFIEKELNSDSYNFVITADDIPKAKKIMAELNKSIDFIDTFRKDKVSVESVAIDLFKKNVKNYVSLINAKREEIKKNVEVFEKETKDSILKELSLYCEEFVKIQGIRDNFLDVNIVDLIVLGSVTGKGSLTKKAKETIESRVNVCKSKQDKYDMRLIQLENESYKAGLESPLTITHIQGIISLYSDAEYETKLNELIESEMNRQKTIKENLQKEADEKARREAQQKVLNEQNRIRDSFYIDFSNLDLAATDSKLATLPLTDYSSFGDFESFARIVVDGQIGFLNIHRDKLLKQANDLLQQMEQNEKVVNNEVPTTHENIPFTQEEKVEQVKEVAGSGGGKKTIRIQAIFEVTVPSHVNPDAVLRKVKTRLLEADISEDTLKSLEVI